jgi:N-carbamoylputrescine amidase
MSGRSLRVAAVQMVSQNGDRRANLERAGLWVQQAAERDATLVALPELFSCGYWLNEDAWDTAEPQNGPTESWLRQTAHHHGVYLGGSYLQARGEDFFDIFALATPAGQIAGRIPKQQPGSVEAFLFRGQESSHVIDTDIGRIGVGICYDNCFRFTADALIAGDADIVVMSFSAPTPQQTWYYGHKRAEAFLASFRHGAQNYARMLGLPALQVNKSGPWSSRLPGLFPAQNSNYDGQSEIADSNGEIVAELAGQEAIIVGDVMLDPARKIRALGHEYTRHGRWIAPVPLEFKFYRVIEAIGAYAYRTNRRRRAKALGKSASAHCL